MVQREFDELWRQAVKHSLYGVDPFELGKRMPSVADLKGASARAAGRPEAPLGRPIVRIPDEDEADALAELAQKHSSCENR